MKGDVRVVFGFFLVVDTPPAYVDGEKWEKKIKGGEFELGGLTGEREVCFVCVCVCVCVCRVFNGF